jgi:peptide/nickel transport system substrate-binding protein
MYHETQTTYDHDPAKAVSLLKSQGFHVTDDRGNITPDVRLTLPLLVSAQEVRMAELIKERLAQVGITVQIISVDGKTRDARVKDRDYQMAIIGHGGWGQDADYLRSRFEEGDSLAPSAAGLSGYRNPALHALLDKQHVETDQDVRRSLVAKIQDIIADDLPEIALFYTTDYTVFRPRTYDGWMNMYDHHCLSHSKLSYLDRKGFVL